MSNYMVYTWCCDELSLNEVSLNIHTGIINPMDFETLGTNHPWPMSPSLWAATRQWILTVRPWTMCPNSGGRMTLGWDRLGRDSYWFRQPYWLLLKVLLSYCCWHTISLVAGIFAADDVSAVVSVLPIWYPCCCWRFCCCKSHHCFCSLLFASVPAFSGISDFKSQLLQGALEFW